MDNLAQRIASLPPTKRMLLDQHLAKSKSPSPVGDSTALPPIRRRNNGGPAPASFAQERIWLLDQLGFGTAYNMPVAVRITGRLNPEVMERCLSEILRRHESLRTTLQCVENSLVQIVSPPGKFDVHETSLEGLNPKVREERLNELRADEAQSAFDLARGPLLRAQLVKLQTTEYVLLLTFHHVIFDGWSAGIFIKEFTSLYTTFGMGRPSPLADLAIQYGDFAVWQRQWLTTGVVEKELSYWKQRLKDVEALDLPTTQVRSAFRNNRAGSQPLRLASGLAADLVALSRKRDITLFILLSAAFKLWLYRQTGQHDIVTGAPIDERGCPEVEGLIGLFVNMVPLRTDLSGDPTFLELLERERKTALEAYEHQSVPFEKLTKELRPLNRDLGLTPLVQAAITLQQTRTEDLQVADLKLELIWTEQRATKFDLVVSFSQGPSGLAGNIEYNAELFDEDAIRQMAARFEKILSEIARDSARRISQLDILPSEENERIWAYSRGASAQYPERKCLHELFEEQVQRTPEAMAAAHRSLTYRELNARANQLAHHLKRFGVGPEVVVPVCMERSVELTLVLLAVLKAGGAYLPIEPSDPAERNARMIAEANSGVVLVQKRFASGGEFRGKRLIAVDQDFELDEPESNLEVEMTPDNLAYMIYTSGSTGQPKGAMNTHRGIVNRLHWMQQTYCLTSADRVLQKTPYTFDVSVWEFFWPLISGAGLVMAEPGGHRDPVYLAKLIEEQQITTVHFVPSMLAAFLAHISKGRLGCLKRVICSGEALPFELVQRWYELFDVELHNLYGPTEAAVDVTSWLCPKQTAEKRVLIGKPISNIQIHVLDSCLNPVPLGARGEIFIGGVGVGRGYWRRPDLTAERFVPDPFSVDPSARLYRTGDLGRYLWDGSIEYLGRIDHQVKLRGFRIELGEIESVIRQHPGVVEAAAVRIGEDESEQLVAYIVPARAEDCIDSSRMHTLPNGMQVSHFHHYETNMLFEEIFVEQTYLKKGVGLRPDACVFDVGANIGLFGLYVHAVCPGAKLYAFEPIPPIFQKLQTNLAIYGIDARLFQCGLSNSEKQAEFSFYPEMTMMSGLYADARQDEQVVRATMQGRQPELTAFADELLQGKFQPDTCSCRLTTLSQIMRQEHVARIDLLKIDVERSEWDVLLGIEPADWPKIDQVVIETHEDRLESVTQLLRRHGFNVCIAREGALKESGLVNIYATRAAAMEDELARPVPPLQSVRKSGTLCPDVIAFLKQRLPEYMVPSAFVVLPQFPISANGKLDRKRLPKPETDNAPAFISPRTEIEQEIANIWMAVLKRPGIGVNDDFFLLGGHSLLATQVIARVREVLKVEIPLRALFEAPGLEAFAQFVEVARCAASLRARQLACVKSTDRLEFESGSI
jgi:amino acid adenylation domain-containing protein/FkbM family methyltransferase